MFHAIDEVAKDKYSNCNLDRQSVVYPIGNVLSQEDNTWKVFGAISSFAR